jgi:hypothetical protein
MRRMYKITFTLQAEAEDRDNVRTIYAELFKSEAASVEKSMNSHPRIVKGSASVDCINEYKDFDEMKHWMEEIKKR